MVAVFENLCSTQRAQQRRGKLIAAARTLFARNGFHGTGMAQISEASGVKVGQIYRDFASKEAIVAAIVETGLADVLEETTLLAAIEAQDHIAIRDWLSRIMRADDLSDEDRLFPEIIAESARNERIAKILRDTDAQFRRGVTSALRALVPAPDKADEIEVVADVILTLAIGCCNRRLADPKFDAASLSARIDRIIDREIESLTG